MSAINSTGESTVKNMEISVTAKNNFRQIENEGVNSTTKKSKDGDPKNKFKFQERIPYVDEDSDAVDEGNPRRKTRHDLVVTRIPTKIELKTLTHMAKRPSVDIEFQDLCYSVRNPRRREGRRTILKSVSGKFRAGELTAIMGPSGAGKSTLMNILVGYVSAGVSGTIKTNGHPRQLRLFNKLSSYILQEDLIQPLLTVQESMEIAANLKLGDELKADEKLLAIDEVLNTLGLTSCRNTRTECLSGGQRKRVSIALELVNNPPVIFLDEPTTGLDIVAIKQCLSMLKLLARQGRTIICTIHQPTASHFQLFDQVYIMAKGLCVYQGAAPQLVPFLSSVGLHCPKHYNPADYVMEMIQGEYAENIKILSAEIQNGKLIKKLDPIVACGGQSSGNQKALTKFCRKETVDVMPAVFNHSLMDSIDGNTEYEFPTSFCQQFSILLRRSYIQQRRNTVSLSIQLFHHLFSAFLLGGVYFKIGEDATKPFSSVKFSLCVTVFFLYTHVMTPVLLFPTAVRHLKREYFNRWYSLKAYYMAMTVASFPSMISFGFLFCLVSYLLSEQPMEVTRFLWFLASGLAVGIVSEGHGLIVGSVFSVANGSVVAPASFTPLLLLAVYGMGHGEAIESRMSFLMSLSYLRYGLVAVTDSLYGHNRPLLSCMSGEFEYCHYKDPKLVLRDLGMAGTTTLGQIVAVIVLAIIYRIVAYLALRCRLTSEFSNQVLNYIAKILRHK
ncbi:ATP-binding cassette subfamily G member 4-like [Periplaneta americana]|uniref:ATP-binding cassette subfamily G member 4-like n=1 Tax=Periplaneta americana TaxID=6978 RepID=UPI0037E86C12